MNVLWLCHYFAPEIGAPQARLLETSRALRELGHNVAVVTCFPNHPTGELLEEDRGEWYRLDDVDGVEVHRCWSFVTPNRGIVKKTLGHLSFMLTGFGGLRRARRVTRPDVVIVSSPTFFSVIPAWIWCTLNGVPWVFEVRDLWPAVFVDLGVLRNKAAIGLLEWIEKFLYRRSGRVVAVTTAFAEDIARRAVPREKVGVVTNGVDEDRYLPGPRDAAMAERLGLTDKFVVLYLGAHGISHALARILDAAELLVDLPDVRFVFVGEGAEKAQLEEAAAARGLGNVLFHGGVPKDEVLSWYHLADVGLVPLRDVQLFHTFIPSKMFELMACALPVVASVAGEAAEILERGGGARVVPPEDAAGIAQAVRELHGDPALRRAMGESGRRFVLANYTRRALAAHYETILSELVVEHAERQG